MIITTNKCNSLLMEESKLKNLGQIVILCCTETQVGKETLWVIGFTNMAIRKPLSAIHLEPAYFPIS